MVKFSVKFFDPLSYEKLTKSNMAVAKLAKTFYSLFEPNHQKLTGHSILSGPLSVTVRAL